MKNCILIMLAVIGLAGCTRPTVGPIEKLQKMKQSDVDEISIYDCFGIDDNNNVIDPKKWMGVTKREEISIVMDAVEKVERQVNMSPVMNLLCFHKEDKVICTDINFGHEHLYGSNYVDSNDILKAALKAVGLMPIEVKEIKEE